LSLVSAGSVFAQAAGPDQNTLKACDYDKFLCDERVSQTKDDVLHRLTKKDYFREIFLVKSKPVPQTQIFIVKEEKAEQVSRPVITEKWFEVVPTTPVTTVEGKNWAYVPK